MRSPEYVEYVRFLRLPPLPPPSKTTPLIHIYMYMERERERERERVYLGYKNSPYTYIERMCVM